jgi:hypothetical protein
MTIAKLDDISTAIEQAVKALRGQHTPTRKRMKLDEFMTFALAEIEKATKDEPGVAKRRLVALKRSVDDVIAGIAKINAEDTESENIDIEVTTAFAPTRTDGDRPMDDITTTDEQSSTEVAVTDVAAATGDSGFAENLGEIAKAIRKLKEGLGATATDKPRGRARKRETGEQERDASGEDGGGDGEGQEDRDRDPDGWPLDMATDAFLKGGTSSETDPVWGHDPAGIASPRGR